MTPSTGPLPAAGGHAKGTSVHVGVEDPMQSNAPESAAAA